MTDQQGNPDKATNEHSEILDRLQADIRRTRDTLLSAFRADMDDWDLLGPDEPPSMVQMHQLSEILTNEADCIESHLQDQKTEIEGLRAAIEVKCSNERREAWRREMRKRLLAGEDPNALPMDADMTFADYFSEVRNLQVELNRREGASERGGDHA